jgi:very-short-patch-repair endonuclease
VVVGGPCRRLDLGWPEAKLALEYEGAHHFEGPQIVLDDERYADLVAAGWRIIRVSASDLRDLDGVVVRIRAALGAA